MDTGKKFQLIKKDINLLRTVEQQHMEKCRVNTSIDKKEFKFSDSPQTSLFNTTVCLSQYTGKYGDSNVEIDFTFHNDKEIKSSFMKYLNQNRQEILQWMADDLEVSNSSLKERYIQELQEELERLS